MSLSAKDLMWSMPPVIPPDTTLKDAAEKMADIDAGILPIGTSGKVEGIITDRDIVVRAVSKGMNPEQEKVSDFMTQEVYSCKENDSIGSAAELMEKNKVSRLVVMNGQNRISGILSFGHIFRNDANAEEATDIITRVASRNKQKDIKAEHRY